MKKLCKKILSVTMAAAMVVSMLPTFFAAPITASAADGDTLFHYTFDSSSYDGSVSNGYYSTYYINRDSVNSANEYGCGLRQSSWHLGSTEMQSESDRYWFIDGWMYTKINPNIRNTSGDVNKNWQIDFQFKYNNLRNSSNTSYVLGIANADTQSEFFGVTANGNLCYNGTALLSGICSFATGTVYNLRYVYNDGRFIVYLDGVKVCTYSCDSTQKAILNSVLYLAIGGSYNVQNGLDCYDLAGYEKQLAVGTASYLTDEASFNEMVSSGEATKTETVTWDSTENAAYFNGGYLTIHDNPFKSANNSTGFTISFDFKRLNTNEEWSRFIDINDGTTNNTFAINAGSDSVNAYKRLLTLAKVNGTESQYYASDTNSSAYCSTPGTESLAWRGDLTNTWHNYTVIMDASGYYSVYFDGALKAIYKNDYNSTDLGHGVTPASIKNQMASMTQVNIGKAIYNDPTFKGYIKNVNFVAQDVRENLSSNATIDDAISFAQAKFFGKAYTNETAAYKAYYNACEALDATEFGGDSGKLNSSRTALITALNNMSSISKPTANAVQSYQANASDGGVDRAASNSVNILSANRNSTSGQTTAASQEIANCSTKIYYGETVLLYDGETQPRFPVTFSCVRTSNKTRYVHTMYPASSDGSKSSSANASTDFDLHHDKGEGHDNCWYGSDTNNNRIDYTYNYTLSEKVGGNATNSDNHWSAKLNNSTTHYYVSACRYIGTPNTAINDFQIKWSQRSSANEQVSGSSITNDDYGTMTSSVHTYVYNYKGINDRIESRGYVVSSINSYKEGGLTTLLGYNDTISRSWSTLMGDITNSNNAYSSISTTNPTVDSRASAYQALRETLRSENNFDGDDFTIEEAYNNQELFQSNADLTNFVNYYEDAVALFAALDNDDNASGYAVNSLSTLTTLNTNLENAFAAIELFKAATPTVSGSTYLGPADTVTVTNNQDNSDLSFVVTYNDSTTYSGTVANGGTIDVFHGYTNKTSASLVVTLTYEGDTFDSEAYNYTYIAPPSFTSDSAGNNVVTSGIHRYDGETPNNEAVYAKSNNSFGDATTQIQYSYDGENFNNTYVHSLGILLFDNLVCDGATSIYIKEVVTKGGFVSESEIVRYTVIKENAFTIFTDHSDGATFFGADSTINIEDTTHYTDDIIFYIEKADGTFILDGDQPKKYTYSKGSGIKLSGTGALADAATVLAEDYVTIYAYSRAANDAGYTNRVSQKIYNSDKFDKFIYHESFNDGAPVNGTYDAKGSKGVDIVQQNTGTISVVEKAGDKQGFHDGTDSGTATDEIGTSADMRRNVLKISGTNQHINDGSAEAYAKLATNPLANDLAKVYAKKKGVTISFWRAIQNGTDTKTNIASGTLKRNAIAFRRPSSADQRGYFMIELTGNMSYAETASNYFDIVPGEYDVTQNSLSKYSGYWQHIAVTINPNAASVEEAINVYINGVPHNVSTSYDQNYDIPTAIDSSGGDYAAATDTVEKTIGDLLDMITDDDVLFCLAHDNQWQGHSDDIYLDDVRIYTDVLTQKDIWETYYDETSDTSTLEGNKASVTHDPTTIAVYTLVSASNGMAAGSKVGQEFIDYYSVPSSNYTVEYYSYGTGLQIYHSTDSVNWEIVGDSQGRVAYQSHDQFVKDNGNGTWSSLEYHAALSEVLTSIRNASNLSYQQGAGHLVWAPHVSYNLTTNKWMMYVAISCWSGATSAIISMESADGTPLHFVARDSSNNQAYSVIVKSQGRPNAIDACTYYKHNSDGTIDKNTLYMAYGAWSQDEALTEDLCTMQLNANGDAKNGGTAPVTYANAMSAEDGTRICASQPEEPEGKTGEGAFITYHGGYYYLYVAYGVNDFNYVTRVFRSTSPTGPFVDYNGVNATDSGAVHGTQIMAPHYVTGDNYIYMSTGHDSIYKAVNNKGEQIMIHSAHARPVSNNANGYKELPDYAMVTRQIALSGSVTITHAMFYTQSGWAISMPEQYNGTDTSSGITATQIDGLYKASTLHDIIDENLSYSEKVYSNSTYSNNWDFSKYIYFSANDATSGVIYGTGDGFLPLDLTYELSYDTGNAATSTTTYITIKNGDSTVAEGVVAMHNNKPELSYFNIEQGDFGGGVDTRASSTVWSVKVGELPDSAVFTNLEEYYNRGDSLLKELSTQAPKYTKASVDALIAAVEAAQENSTKSIAKKKLVPASQQGTLDAQESAIETAISNLTVAPAGVGESVKESYEAVIEKVNNIINNIDSDIYDSTAFTKDNVTTAISDAVSESESSYMSGAYTINTVDNAASEEDIENATSDALEYISTHYKHYKIYVEQGTFDISADAKLNGTIDEVIGSDEGGTYSYIGSANTSVLASSSVDTAWYMSYTSAGTTRSKQYQNSGKTFSTPLIGDMHIWASQRTESTPNKITVSRYYSDNTSSHPVQCTDYVNGSYELPQPAAIPYYNFVNYTVGETAYAPGATIQNISSDITVHANYTKATENEFAVKVSTVGNDGDVYNESAEYNQKIEASDPEAYAWVETVGTTTRLFFIGSEFTMFVTESTTIQAITEAEFNAAHYSAPKVNLRNAGTTITAADNNRHKITFNGQIVIVDTDDIVECGILVGKAKAEGSITNGDMILQNTGDNTGFKILRAKSTKMVGANQFTIGVTTNITGEFKYRGYVIYQNENNELITVYGDVVDDAVTA